MSLLPVWLVSRGSLLRHQPSTPLGVEGLENVNQAPAMVPVLSLNLSRATQPSETGSSQLRDRGTLQQQHPCPENPVEIFTRLFA